MTTATLEQMAKAFEAWENGFRADPSKYLTAEEAATAEVSTLSADRAAYFNELLALQQPISHRDRVRAEVAELEKKAHALSQFIGHSPIFATLDPAEQERMKVQNDVMWQYVEVLQARINAF